MGPLLFLIGLAIAGAAIFAFFKPLPKLRMATRQSAAIGLVLGLASCVTGLSLPEGTKPASQATPSAKSPIPADDKAELQAEADQLWTKVKTEIARCDALVGKAGSAMTGTGDGSASIYDAYEATTVAERACADANVEMASFDPPEHAKGEVKSAFKEAIETCSFMASSRQIAMKSSGEVLNGDSSPKRVTEAREDMASARAFSTKCILDLMSAAEKGGIVLSEFKAGKKPAS